ncbi:MAG TPA: MFS transporter [Burkholderiaceae bacterium]|nr:MFS transporter [Burkholderiaceae bacterium]
MREVLRALPATVWVLGLISLLNDAASELVYPLLPLYLATVLGAGPRALGFIEGAAEATSALLKLVSGVWYDRVRRAKLFVVAGYGFAAVSRPLIALVASWPMLLALRVLDRLGKGLRSSPRDALLARSVPAARRGVAFGVHRAFDNAGAVVGPLLAAALLALHVPLRDILLWAAVPGALCVALALSLKEPDDGVVALPTKPDWRWRGLPPGFQRMLGAISVFTLGQASNTFVILRAHDLGMPVAQTALLWAAVAATSTVLAVPLSAHSDRVGRVPLLALGWALHAVLFVVLGWTSDVALMWPAAILLGIYMAATEGSERALIADLVPQERLGTAYGWYYLAKGLLLLPASAMFGWLWVASGATTAFMVSSSLVALATLALVAWVRPAVRHAHRGGAA